MLSGLKKISSRRAKALFAAAVALFVLMSFGGERTYRGGEASGGAVSATAGKVAVEDSDADGLKDWEEILWKTDPFNSDTDGDGTADGDEVLAGRNPLDASSDDAYFPKSEPVLSSTSENSVHMTATERLAKAFFAEYLRLKNSGELNEGEEEKLFETFAEKGVAVVDAPPSLSLADLYIVGDGALPVEDYGKSLAEAMGPMFSIKENEGYALLMALKEGKDEKFAELRQAAAIYAEIAENMAKMKTPESAAEIHLDLANDFLALSDAIGKMASVREDPLSAAVGIKEYEKAQDRMTKDFNRLAEYLSEK